jgi:hypothetical protein
MEFIITGIVEEKESGLPIPGLLVRAFDRDLLFSDLLGAAITNDDGSFILGYQGVDFKDLFEQHPDIYLDIYASKVARDPASSQAGPIYTSYRWVRFNAGRKEFFRIKIPRHQLGEDAPGHSIVEPPQEGPWKDTIDAYIEDHPINFHYDPEKGFMRPLLSIDLDINASYRRGGSAIAQVTNQGNGLSFNTYVELYIGPTGSQLPLSAYTLRDYAIITIHPGQMIKLKLKWGRLDPPCRILGVCYDPFLDPRDFEVVESHHRQFSSIFVGKVS